MFTNVTGGCLEGVPVLGARGASISHFAMIGVFRFRARAGGRKCDNK